jgi:hypothetical protein
MPSPKRSLVLHYDEQNERIVFFSIAAEAALALRKGEGFEIPLSDFRAVPADEAERRLGEGVFHMFDRFAERKTGIRDYAGEFERDIEAMISDLESPAASGNAKAKYDLSLLYHDLAIRRHSSELMGKAESLTREAAALGDAAAIDALANWELMLRAFHRRAGKE